MGHPPSSSSLAKLRRKLVVLALASGLLSVARAGVGETRPRVVHRQWVPCRFKFRYTAPECEPFGADVGVLLLELFFDSPVQHGRERARLECSGRDAVETSGDSRLGTIRLKTFARSGPSDATHRDGPEEDSGPLDFEELAVRYLDARRFDAESVRFAILLDQSMFKNSSSNNNKNNSNTGCQSDDDYRALRDIWNTWFRSCSVAFTVTRNGRDEFEIEDQPLEHFKWNLSATNLQSPPLKLRLSKAPCSSAFALTVNANAKDQGRANHLPGNENAQAALIEAGKKIGVKTYDIDLNVAKGVSSGMLNAFKALVSTGFKTAKLLMPTSKMLQKTADYSITHLVATELARVIMGPISHDFSHPTASKITELLTPKVVKVMVDYVDKHASKKSGVPEEVAVRLNTTVSQALGVFAEDKLSHLISSKVISDAGNLLALALSNTLPPALIQTLSHSPMTDYYCYYCMKEKVYCEYCHLESTQVYYAQYYAGYYSRYYSTYYANYFAETQRYAAYRSKRAETISDKLRGTLNLEMPIWEYLQYGTLRPEGYLPNDYKISPSQYGDKIYSEDSPEVPKYPGVKPS